MEKKTDGKKDVIDDRSREAVGRTNDAMSQGDLPEPRLKKEDLPEADRDRFKDGKYRGTGTGAGPGGSSRPPVTP